MTTAALFWGRFCQFCLHELPWPPPLNDSGTPSEAPPGQAFLSGTWQASEGATFRIDDDGKTATIQLIQGNPLIEFFGKLTRGDKGSDAKSLTGTLDAVFRPDAPKRHSIHVTAVIDDSDHLRLRCSDWPTWANRGRNIGKKTLTETWTRLNGASAQHGYHNNRSGRADNPFDRPAE